MTILGEIPTLGEKPMMRSEMFMVQSQNMANMTIFLYATSDICDQILI
jgi:hypothetical protein